MRASQAPRELSAADFVIDGVAPQADSLAIAQRLGTADSAVVDRSAVDCGEHPLRTWHYRGLAVTLGPDGRAVGLLVRGAARATARGLHAGDPAERLRRLYGPPSRTAGDEWEYHAASSDLVLRASVRNRRVAWIYLGR